MGRLKFTIVSVGIKHYDGTRINQGETSAGPETQSTILRSCVCVGFYHPTRKIGAISHVTGFSNIGDHDPVNAIQSLRKRMHKFDLDLKDCECFVVGGSDRARHVYDSTVKALKEASIAFEPLDVLGTVHRKILLDPQKGELFLYKKDEKDLLNKAHQSFSADPDGKCFHDPMRRVLTGASLFFRNRPMLKCFEQRVLPEIVENFNRLHIWCAGCSTGMEVYSIAMVADDWISKHKTNFPLTVLGSDISDQAIKTALEGIYPVTLRCVAGYEKVFLKYAQADEVGRRVIVGPEMRRIATFRQRDIRTGSRLHKFELIVCDHVFQYFEPKEQCELVVPLVRAMQPKGYLYLSSPWQGMQSFLTDEFGLEKIDRGFYRTP
jgi:chemotaxis methyl-accepting protein methylase/chemotaxis receptor (MCP) glutamine deamidase CheD